MAPRHAAVVVNPLKTPIDRLRRAVDAEAGRRGWDDTRWYETDRDDSGAAAAVRALSDDPEVVIVAGGDGTVRAVAEVVHASGTPLALVPAGTGNLLARNLGLPLNDLEGAVAKAFGDRTRAIDVAVAEFEDESGRRSTRMFLVMAGIGLDAEMAANTNPLAKRRLGWLAYVSPIARSIVGNRLFRADYRIDDGHARSARAHTIIVGNCGTLTGSMLLIPAASPDDGLLDVVMLRPRGRFGWAGIGARLTMQGIAHRSRLGRGVLRLTPDLRALAYAQGRRFDVRFETPHAVELDGDAFGLIVRARITVRPGALRICIGDAA